MSVRKIRRRLPIIRVGFIKDIIWTNGNRYCPTNPIDADLIQEFTRVYEKKINWSDNNNGTIILEGHYNYLIYNEGEFFFLEKIKVHDIEKEVYTYAVIRDIKQYYLAYNQLEVRGTLSKTNDEPLLWTHLQKTKALINNPNAVNYIPSIPDKSVALVNCSNFKPEQFEDYWVTKDDLKYFLQTLKDQYTKAKTERIVDPNRDFQLKTLLPLRKIDSYKKYILQLLKDFIDTDKEHMRIVNVTNLPGLLNTYIRSLGNIKQNLALVKVNIDGVDKNFPSIFTSEVENKGLKNMDFSSIDDIEFLDLAKDIGGAAYTNLYDLPTHPDSATSKALDYRWTLAARYYGKTELVHRSEDTASLRHSMFYRLSKPKLQALGLAADFDTGSGGSRYNNLQASYFSNHWWGRGYTQDIYKKLKEKDREMPYDSKLGFLLFTISNYHQSLLSDDIYSCVYNKDTTTSLTFVTGLTLSNVKVKCDNVINVLGATQGNNPKISYSEAYSNLSHLQGPWLVLNTNYLLGVADIQEYVSGRVGETLGMFKTTCTFATPNNILITEQNRTTYNLPPTNSPTHVYYTANPRGNDSQLSQYVSMLKDLADRRHQIEITEEKTAPGFVLNKGDTYWNNAEYAIFEQWNHRNWSLPTPTLAVIYGKNRYSGGSDFIPWYYRLGVIERYDFDLNLSQSEDNLIAGLDSKVYVNDDYKPYIYVEKPFLSKAQLKTSAGITKDQIETRIKAALEWAWTEFEKDWLPGKLGFRDANGQKIIRTAPSKTTFINSFRREGKSVNTFYLPKEIYAVRTRRWYVLGSTTEFVAKDVEGAEIMRFDINIYDKTNEIIAKLNKKFKDIYEEVLDPTGGLIYSTNLETIFNYIKEPSYSAQTTHEREKFKSSGLAAYIGEADAAGEGYLDSILYELGIKYAPNFGFVRSNTQSGYIKINEDILKQTKQKGNASLPARFYFELKRKNKVVAIAAIQWLAGQPKPSIEIIFIDQSKIEYDTREALTVDNESMILDDIAEAINQKNDLYIYGQKIPVQTKLSTNTGVAPFTFKLEELDSKNNINHKYRLLFDSALDNIDQIITVAKQLNTAIYEKVTDLDLETYRLEAQDRAKRLAYEIELNAENARLLNQTQVNRVDDYQWELSQQWVRQINVGAGIVSSAGSGAAAGGLILGPAGASAGAVIGAAVGAVKGISSGISNWQENNRALVVGQRGVDQGEIDTRNQITLAKNSLDVRHQIESNRERLHILQIANNSSNWVATDRDEIKALNTVLFSDSEINVAIVNKKPKGELLEEIKNYYSRHGVDIFLPNHIFRASSLEPNKESIIQFHSVESLSVEDFHSREQLKALFENGLLFKRFDYEIITEDKVKQIRLHEAEIEARRKKLEEEQAAERKRRLEEIAAAEEARQKVISNVNAIKAELDALKIKAQKLEDDNAKLQAEIGGYDAKCTNEKGALTTQCDNEKRALVQTHTAELTRVKGDKDRIQEELDKQIKISGEVSERIRTCESKLNDAESQLRTIRAQLAAKDALLSATKDDLATTNSRLETSESERARQATMITQLEAQTEEDTRLLTEAATKLSECKAAFSTTEQQLKNANADLKNKRQTITRQGNRITALSRDKTKLDGEKRTLTQQVSDLTTQLEMCNNKIPPLESEITTLKQTNADQTTTIADKDKTIKSHTDEITTLKQTNAEQTITIANNENTITANEAEIDRLDKEVEALRAQISGAAPCPDTKALNDKITMLELNKTNLTRYNANLITQLSSEKRKSDSFKAQADKVPGLNQQITDLTEQAARDKAAITTKDNQISGLNATNANLRQQIAVKDKKIRDDGMTISEFTRENNDFRRQNTELQNQLDAKGDGGQGQIATLNEQIRQLNQQKATLEENFTNLNRQNTILEQQKTTLQTNYDALNKEHDALKTTCANLSTEANKISGLNAKISRLDSENKAKDVIINRTVPGLRSDVARLTREKKIEFDAKVAAESALAAGRNKLDAHYKKWEDYISKYLIHRHKCEAYQAGWELLSNINLFMVAGDINTINSAPSTAAWTDVYRLQQKTNLRAFGEQLKFSTHTAGIYGARNIERSSDIGIEPDWTDSRVSSGNVGNSWGFDFTIKGNTYTAFEPTNSSRSELISSYYSVAKTLVQYMNLYKASFQAAKKAYNADRTIYEKPQRIIL